MSNLVWVGRTIVYIPWLNLKAWKSKMEDGFGQFCPILRETKVPKFKAGAEGDEWISSETTHTETNTTRPRFRQAIPPDAWRGLPSLECSISFVLYWVCSLSLAMSRKQEKGQPHLATRCEASRKSGSGLLSCIYIAATVMTYWGRYTAR